MENSDFCSFSDTILAKWTGGCYRPNAIEWYIDERPNNSLIVDIFPNTIFDLEKYYQVSVFYRKWIDGDINKKTFLRHEQKYLNLIKSLWLCNTSDICYDLSFNHYFRKGRIFSPFMTKLPPTNVQQDVKDWNVIEKVVTYALREAGCLMLYFREWEILAVINDFSVLILTKDSAVKKSLCSMANVNNLHVHSCPHR